MDDELGEQEEAMVSWTADPKKGEEGGEGGNVNGKGPVILESMLFKDDAKEVGIVEVCRVAVCVFCILSLFYYTVRTKLFECV